MKTYKFYLVDKHGRRKLVFILGRSFSEAQNEAEIMRSKGGYLSVETMEDNQQIG